ncbi:3-hydroxyacyl-ACP dehydratase FabZ [Rheinheimera baltica]|uniref:3-hydroxyacyl-[acyl-carrier-protein] dehydratase FabZ n=1 Tax=Rheinheimera baltica TaxID=67576 RepID=A0ABT9HVG3_9GAMM|nr:3-hydroxyacyl-ACP dehydratase FabZ [Rheinheimera baltica]MDP5135117.1 3-hydroxyacyl-ACP dehydratase FabZ [Rheinheimera baltica]
MSIIDIESVLPHRYPFLMVDSVTGYEKNCGLRAIKNVSKNEPALQGHFPGNAVFPGVLIIEALAQAAGILWAQSNADVLQNSTLCYLAGTEKTKFKRKVIPGDQLQLDIKVVCLKRKIMKVTALASVNGNMACSTTISLFAEYPEQQPQRNFITNNHTLAPVPEEKSCIVQYA